MLTKSAVLLIFAVFLILASSQAQFNTQDSINITTYYLSPNGAFNSMEIKKAINIGDMSDPGNATYKDFSALQDGQIYIGDSLIIQPLASAPASATEGQLWFNNTTTPAKLQFHNGTQWKNVGG
jgi:hypothetical protein